MACPDDPNHYCLDCFALTEQELEELQADTVSCVECGEAFQDDTGEASEFDLICPSCSQKY